MFKKCKLCFNNFVSDVCISNPPGEIYNDEAEFEDVN